MNSCSVTWLAARPTPPLLSCALSWPLSLCCPLPHRLFVLYSVFRTTTKPGAMDQMRLAFNGVVRSQPTFCTLSRLYHCLYHEQTDKTEAIAKWQALFSFFVWFFYFLLLKTTVALSLLMELLNLERVALIVFTLIFSRLEVCVTAGSPCSPQRMEKGIWRSNCLKMALRSLQTWRPRAHQASGRHLKIIAGVPLPSCSWEPCWYWSLVGYALKTSYTNPSLQKGKWFSLCTLYVLHFNRFGVCCVFQAIWLVISVTVNLKWSCWTAAQRKIRQKKSRLWLHQWHKLRLHQWHKLRLQNLQRLRWTSRTSLNFLRGKWPERPFKRL